MKDPGLGPVLLVLAGALLIAAGFAGATGLAFSVSEQPCVGTATYASTWTGIVGDGRFHPVNPIPATVDLYRMRPTGVGELVGTGDGSAGTYRIDLAATVGGVDYRLVARAVGYDPQAKTVTSACPEDVAVPPWTHSENFYLQPLPGLEAGFTWVPEGLVLHVTDASSGGPDSWTWVWGDGASDTLSVPTANHTYAAAGTYSVTLTVTRSTDGAEDSETASVTLQGPPGDTDTGVTDDFTRRDVAQPRDPTLFLVAAVVGLILIGAGVWWYREASGS